MRLLGLRGLTWARLADLSGGKLDPEKAAQITHKSGSRGGGQQHQQDDVELKFGNAKKAGKTRLSECADDDVRWYIAAWKRDLADPAKEKYHRFCKRDLDIAEAMLAKRANAQAGIGGGPGAAGGGDKPSPWQRIRALDRQLPEEELKAIVKDATKKANAAQLTDEDVAIVAKAIEAKKAANPSDIPF